MDDHVLNREIRYGDGPEGVPEAFSTLQTVPLEDPYNRQDPEAFSTLQTVPLEDPYNRQDPQVVEFAEGKEVYVREYVQDPQVVEFAEGKEVYVREHIQDPQVVEFAEGKEVHVRGHVQGRQIHKLVKPEINFSLLKRFRKQICVAVAALGSILVIAVVGAVVEVKDHRSVANAPSTPYDRSTNIAVSSSKIFTSSINVSIPSPSSSISSVNASTAPSNSFTSDTNISIPSSDAYNGTGLSVTHSLLSSPQVVLFYQHSAGSIRASRLVNDVWQPYDQTQDLIVPSGARSGTPIGSVSYYIGSCCDTEVWQVFYADSSNMLRDKIRRNASEAWEDGILADSKIQISDTVSTGLFGLYSAWFSNSPPAGGIKVFYGDANNLVHVHAWDADGNAWTEGFTFPDENGNAGIWATSVGSLAYAYLLNSAGNVQMWWKDFNTTIDSTEHPVGVWNKGPSAGGNIRSNSSVAFDGSQGSGFVQLSNGTFALIGVTQNSESSTMAASQAQSGSVTGILDSRVAVYTPSSNNTQTTYVLYQIDGGDITQFAHTRPQGS